MASDDVPRSDGQSRELLAGAIIWAAAIAASYVVGWLTSAACAGFLHGAVLPPGGTGDRMLQSSVKVAAAFGLLAAVAVITSKRGVPWYAVALGVLGLVAADTAWATVGAVPCIVAAAWALLTPALWALATAGAAYLATRALRVELGARPMTLLLLAPVTVTFGAAAIVFVHLPFGVMASGRGLYLAWTVIYFVMEGLVAPAVVGLLAFRATARQGQTQGPAAWMFAGSCILCGIRPTDPVTSVLIAVRVLVAAGSAVACGAAARRAQLRAEHAAAPERQLQ
jgi:hypothetical protein